MLHGKTPVTETSFQDVAKIHILPSTTKTKPTNLLILCHGLNGSHDDYNRWITTLSANISTTTNPQSFFVVVPTTNEGWPLNHPTHQGILHSATLAYKAVQTVITEHPEATELQNIIVVGHSFGGIYSRALIKMMADDGTIPRLRPLGYISIASPHLGVRRKPSAFTSVFQFFAPLVGGVTGTELLLEDEADVVLHISQGEYLEALKMFQSRTCYGNVYNDLQVPLCTATLRDYNPYRTGTIEIKDPIKYPSIVSVSNEKNKSEQEDAGTLFSSNVMKEKIRTIHGNLLNLGWNRYDCLHNGIDVHNQIVGNGAAGWSNEGCDIRSHVVNIILDMCKENEGEQKE